MSASDAADFLLRDPNAVRRCLSQLPPLLPSMSVDVLLELAKYLDPGRPAIHAASFA